MNLGLRNLLRHFLRRSVYRPLIEVRVFSEHLLHNLEVFRKLSPKTAVAPVLKGNAYGHGLVEVGTIMDEVDMPFIAVDSLYEAYVLRRRIVGAYRNTPLLVIGYTSAENIADCRLKGVAFTLVGIEQVRETCSALSRKTALHLKVDTGMHRQGILSSDIPEAIKLLKRCKYADLEGICSHLGDADRDDPRRTLDQIEAWHSALDKVRKAFPALRYWHLSNTAGSAYADRVEANVMRLGIGLYGIDPSPFRSGVCNTPLRPALEMRTRIASIREIGKGESIGYNATYTASYPMRIATVPVGYYEGVDRRLSNKGFFLVHGKPCPIVGRVSMNITTIDVSEVPGAKAGDGVIVISARTEDPNSVENIARLCETTQHDVTCHIPPHLRRVVT